MTLTRRELLKNGVVTLSAAALAPSWLKQAAEAAGNVGGKNSGPILIALEFSGGNDGLNMVIPFQDGRYRDVRPAIGIDGAKALPITSDLALHPAMTDVRDLFRSGKLAVIEGVGYPNPNRSHFRSMEIWQTANPESVEYYGWLGRYLDSNGHSSNPLQALTLGGDLPLALEGAKVDVPAIGSINEYGLVTIGSDREKALRTYRRINSRPAARNSDREFLQQMAIEALESSEEMKRKIKPSSAIYPQNPLATKLKEIAQILSADVGTTIAYVKVGSFDTHAGQLNTQQRLLGWVSESLGAFWKDLTDKGLADRTLLFTFSEFGRRVHENGGQGTDHGTAGPMFVLGGGVRGGIVYGDTPDLGNLDSNGDLKFQNDFRSVYSTILGQWMGADPEKAFGRKFPTIPFVSV